MIFSLWCLVKDALLSDDVKVKEQLENLTKTFEEIQDVESVSSIKSFEEWKVKSHKRDLKEKKETLEKEIALIKKKLVKEGRQFCRAYLLGGDCCGKVKCRRIVMGFPPASPWHVDWPRKVPGLSSTD